MAMSISDHTQPKMFKSTFIFLQSFSACKKSCWLTKLLLIYRWFHNPEIWLVQRSFDIIPQKHYKPSFIFLESISPCQNHQSLLDIYLIWQFCNLIGREHLQQHLIENLQTTFYISWIYTCMSKIVNTQLKISNHLSYSFSLYQHIKKSSWLN